MISFLYRNEKKMLKVKASISLLVRRDRARSGWYGRRQPPCQIPYP